MTPAGDFLFKVIRPTLQEIGLWSAPAEMILLGTACIESDLQYRHQIGGGPASGLFGMEDPTHHDCWVNWLNGRPDLARKIVALCPPDVGAIFDQLEFNDAYACAMARVKYERAPGEIPADVDGQAAYYVLHYNAGGKSTTDKYKAHWAAHGCGALFQSLTA